MIRLSSCTQHLHHRHYKDIMLAWALYWTPQARPHHVSSWIYIRMLGQTMSLYGFTCTLIEFKPKLYRCWLNPTLPVTQKPLTMSFPQYSNVILYTKFDHFGVIRF